MSYPGQARMERASILEIVTFGFKGMVKSMLPLTLIALPYVLLAGIDGYFYFRMSLSGQPDLLAALGHFATQMIGMYFFYCASRYIRDVYWEEAGNPLAYLLPRMTLFGALAIGFFYLVTVLGIGVGVGITAVLMALLGPLGLVVMIGGILCLIPVVIYIATYFCLAFAVYLGTPENGLFAAMRESFRMINGNFWRSMGLATLVWIINLIITAPVLGVFFALGMLSTMSASVADTPMFLLGFAGLMAVASWSQVVLGQGGLVFVLYRYYYDLRIRLEGGQAVDLAEYRERPASRSQQY